MDNNERVSVEKFYDFITSKMSAEKALKLLLASSTITYNKLRFPDGDQQSQVHPLLVMAMAAMDMGWNFIVKEGDEKVQGLVTGTDEYCDNVSFKNNNKAQKLSG